MAATHLGMPSLIEFDDLTRQISACRELGLDFVELNLDCPQYLPERIDPRYLRSVTEQTGVGFTAHLPENLDLASFHAPVREGYLSIQRTVIEWASQAGISLLNMHLNPGAHFTLPTHKVWLYEQYADDYRRNLLASFHQLCDLAQEYQVAL